MEFDEHAKANSVSAFLSALKWIIWIATIGLCLLLASSYSEKYDPTLPVVIFAFIGYYLGFGVERFRRMIIKEPQQPVATTQQEPENDFDTEFEDAPEDKLFPLALRLSIHSIVDDEVEALISAAARSKMPPLVTNRLYIMAKYGFSVNQIMAAIPPQYKANLSEKMIKMRIRDI